MRIGMSLTSSLQAPDTRTGAQWMIERATAAHAAELASLSLGDHHAVASPYYQNVPMLGRLLAIWHDRPAGCLFLLPLWHPVLVAEQVGTLAQLASGPFILQAGIGSGADQFAAMGASLTDRGRRTDAAIDVIDRLLAGEAVDSDEFGLHRATISPRPPEGVEWWVGAGAAPAALDRAARLGDVWYAGPQYTVPGARQVLEGYREACAARGRTPRAVLRRDVVVLPDGDRARRIADEAAAAGYRGMPRGALVAGAPDEVAHHLGVYADLGFEQVVCRCLTPVQADALTTIESLGEVQRLLA